MGDFPLPFFGIFQKVFHVFPEFPRDFDDFWRVGDTPTAKAATNFDKDMQDMKLEKVQKEWWSWLHRSWTPSVDAMLG